MNCVNLYVYDHDGVQVDYVPSTTPDLIHGAGKDMGTARLGVLSCVEPFLYQSHPFSDSSSPSILFTYLYT